MVRVFLVDDHEVVRRGLVDLLESDPELEVVGEAGSVAEAGGTARHCCAGRSAARRQRNRIVPRFAVRPTQATLSDVDLVHV